MKRHGTSVPKQSPGLHRPPESKARKSGNRLSYSIKSPKLARLRSILLAGEANLWALGDELNRLVSLGYNVKYLGDAFKQERNRLSEIRQTALTFPPKMRKRAAAFTHYELARSASKKFNSESFPLPPLAALRKIKLEGWTQRRDVFAGLGQAKAEAENAANPQLVQQVVAQSGDLLDRCHHALFQQVAATMAERNVRVMIFNADVPYASYTKTNNGVLDMSTACARTECDNNDRDAALRVTFDAIELAPTILAPGGVMLLWQAATPLRVEILQAIDAAELEIKRELWWDKGGPTQLENPEDCYGASTERCLVIMRRGEQLKNHDPTISRSNLLRFSRIQQRAETSHEHHQMEKPQDLMEFLLRKHSYEGDIVFDAFGCSGSCCLAASRLNRRWIYSESNRANFEFGSRRIALTTARRKAA